MLGHFGALVPGSGSGGAVGAGVMIDAAMASRTASVAVAGESGPVFGSLPFAVAWHGWKVSQHREPGGALHQSPDRGTPKSDDQVHLPSGLALPGRRPRRGVG